MSMGWKVAQHERVVMPWTRKFIEASTHKSPILWRVSDKRYTMNWTAFLRWKRICDIGRKRTNSTEITPIQTLGPSRSPSLGRIPLLASIHGPDAVRNPLISWGCKALSVGWDSAPISIKASTLLSIQGPSHLRGWKCQCSSGLDLACLGLAPGS